MPPLSGKRTGATPDPELRGLGSAELVPIRVMEKEFFKFCGIIACCQETKFRNWKNDSVKHGSVSFA